MQICYAKLLTENVYNINYVAVYYNDCWTFDPHLRSRPSTMYNVAVSMPCSHQG